MRQAQNKLYTMPDASRLLGLNYRKLLRLVDAGEVRYTKIGPWHLMSSADILDAMERLKRGDIAYSPRPLEMKAAIAV